MIYLLRHAETVWNTLGRFQGQKDSPLTTHGVEQADFVGKALHRELSQDPQSFEMQVSPLGRTRVPQDGFYRLNEGDFSFVDGLSLATAPTQV